jgi:hypothetical protein
MSPSEESINFVTSSNDGGAEIYPNNHWLNFQAEKIKNLRISSKFIGAEGGKGAEGISVFTGGAAGMTGGSMLGTGWVTIGLSLMAKFPMTIGIEITGLEVYPEDYFERIN